jgi:hypothetical protein
VGRASTPLWLHWLVIARDHADEARAQAGPHPSLAEFHAAMVAVSASAFAIDGLYGAVKQVVTPPPSNAARQRRILELLKFAFRIGPKVGIWLSELDWVFADVRRPAVHHGEEFHETVPHPELEVHVSVEDRDYSAAGAERAVRIALDVVHTCFDNPKPVTAEWVERRRPVMEQLLKR